MHDPSSHDAAASAFLELVRRRGSCRRYDAARTVPRAHLRTCVEAARLAPSACNRQPWRFVIVDAPEPRRKLCARARRLGIAHSWWEQVPVFVVLGADRSWLAHRLAPAVSGIDYHLLDLGIAGEHFVLAATELGLGTCWIGWFHARVVRELLDIPRRVQVAALITVGYPAGPLPAAGPRRDAATLMHWNGWGGSE